jgi:hypothetical protein
MSANDSSSPDPLAPDADATVHADNAATTAETRRTAAYSSMKRTMNRFA